VSASLPASRSASIDFAAASRSDAPAIAAARFSVVSAMPEQ
jgi:hypothetical protein